MSNIDFEKRLDDKPRILLAFDVRLARTVSVTELVACLEKHASVARVRVEQSTG
jgi:hypothetical protein